MSKKRTKKTTNKKKQLNTYLKFSTITIQMAVIIALSVLFGGWVESKFLFLNGLTQALISLIGVFIALYLVVKNV